jgi:hypothetical protein
MSLFSFIGGIFKPAADLIDNVHTSEEEKLSLRNQLSQIEAQVTIKMVDLQSSIIEANSKLAIAEQEHGNWLSKSWRPLASMVMTSILVSMGFGFIEFNELLAQISGAFLGVYGIGRSIEKKSK